MKYIHLSIFLLAITLSWQVNSQETVTPDPVDDTLVQAPDKEPEYPGGASVLQQFIINNVNYPLEAIEKGEQGRVFLSFEVTADGSIENIKVERGISESLNNEAIRLVSIMPNWISGELNNKKVRALCRLPIRFTLEYDEPEPKRKRRK